MAFNRIWSALRLAGEILFLLLTAAFFVLDARGVPELSGDGWKVDWQWLALATVTIWAALVYWRVLQQQGEIRRFWRTRAPLEVYFDPEDPGTLWPDEHWYRIRVRNKSRFVQAHDTTADLEKMTPYALPFKALPSKLLIKDGKGRVKSTINPERSELFDFFSRVPEKERVLRLWIEPSVFRDFELEPNVEYEFLIVVSAANHEEPKPTTLVVKHPLGQEPEVFIRHPGAEDMSGQERAAPVGVVF